MNDDKANRPPTIDVVRGALHKRGVAFQEEAEDPDEESLAAAAPRGTRFVLPTGAYLVVLQGRYDGFSLGGVRQRAGHLDEDLERVCGPPHKP